MGSADRRDGAMSVIPVRAPSSSCLHQSQIANRKLQIRRGLFLALLLSIASTGCTHRVKYYRPGEQPILTRDVVEFPANTQMSVMAEGLTGPTCICFDYQKNILFV